MSKWKYESAEQKATMDELVTEENCAKKLRLMGYLSGQSQRSLAKVLGCSESTIYRLENKWTAPTAAFRNQLQGLGQVGYVRFSMMSRSERESISETLGAVGGVAAGGGVAVGTISAAGSVAGLSGAGITSGLAAIGGTMLGGILVVIAIPVVVGLGGYGLVKVIKAICAESNLNCEDMDDRYEKIIDNSGPSLG